jgi:uncharacterized repeat protein (TIGR03803 family)
MTHECKRIYHLLGLMLAGAMASLAQEGETSPDIAKFKTLFNFGGTNGQWALVTPVQGTDGNFYGTTLLGGRNSGSCFTGIGCGTVFRMTPSGTLTEVYSFCSQPNCADGAEPSDYGFALALGTDGNFYGVTGTGGSSATSGPCAPYGCGTIFKITRSGTLTTLYNFCSQPNCIDGITNYAGVVRGADGNFYGTTAGGGAFTNSAMCFGGSVGNGCGTVFKITPAGSFTTLYSFCSQANCTDGASPYTGLVSGTDGDLYGMTSVGGTNGNGIIFKITFGGTITTLHSFGGTNGNCGTGICSPMIQARNGNFYGTTTSGGANTGPSGPAGTLFEINAKGVFTTLYNFCSQSNCADGASPFGLVQGNDGNFYGVTANGGLSSCSNGCGTLFKVTPNGVLTALYQFNGARGQNPLAALAQATNGTFFGDTWMGGTHNLGTVFSLSVGLGPFVETLPTIGKVGSTVKILGTNLTAATGVKFNGTPAVFTVVSASEITTTVPTGATTGFVTVSGPNHTLKSNAKFQVRP